MSEREAFEIVLNKLKENNLFCGCYDAVNGNEHFMYGVATVMENIAYSVDNETGEKFTNEFLNNLLESER